MQNMRALVVDDSKVGRLTMQKKLESFGIRVDLAESGLEALGYLERQRPDVIFMDHMMPGLDGFEATRRIKSAPATRDIPVIIISGADDETFVRDARAVGADGAIAKPPSTEAIERILTALPRTAAPLEEAPLAFPPPQPAAPVQPAAVPDEAAIQALVEKLLGQAVERLHGSLQQTLRQEWTAAIEQERQARQTWQAQIGQRLDSFAAAQGQAAHAAAEAQAAQLSGLAARLAALEDAARQTAAAPEAWFEAVEARLGPRLQAVGAEVERQGALMEDLQQALAGRLDALAAREAQAAQALAGRVDALAEQVERLSAAAASQQATLGERVVALEQRQAALEAVAAAPPPSGATREEEVAHLLDERLAGIETQVAALDAALRQLQAQLQGGGEPHTAPQTALSEQLQLLRDDIEQRLAQLRGELAEMATRVTVPPAASAQASGAEAVSPPVTWDADRESALAQRLADQLDGRWQAEVAGLRRRIKMLTVGAAMGGALLAAALVLAL